MSGGHGSRPDHASVAREKTDRRRARSGTTPSSARVRESARVCARWTRFTAIIMAPSAHPRGGSGRRRRADPSGRRSGTRLRPHCRVECFTPEPLREFRVRSIFSISGDARVAGPHRRSRRGWARPARSATQGPWTVDPLREDCAPSRERNDRCHMPKERVLKIRPRACPVEKRMSPCRRSNTRHRTEEAWSGDKPSPLPKNEHDQQGNRHNQRPNITREGVSKERLTWRRSRIRHEDRDSRDQEHRNRNGPEHAPCRWSEHERPARQSDHRRKRRGQRYLAKHDPRSGEWQGAPVVTTGHPEDQER